MNKKLFTLLIIGICFLNMLNTQKVQATTYEGSVVTEKGAWCWFADPRALYYENTEGSIKNTYIGYIDVHGSIKATQYNHLKDEKKEVLIRSYFQPDDHDNPTFLTLPDGRIMIFYSRHTDEPCFYYRISKNPGDITTLGEEKVLKTSANTTYPSPFILSDDPDHIYLCWRGISWHPTIGRLTMPDANDDVTFDWGPKQIVQSTAARPYAKYASNGKDKIYLTYTLGHPDNENPNWVYFNYIHINTDGTKIKLTDVKDKQLSIINDEVHKVNRENSYFTVNPDAVVNKESYRNWVWQVSKEAAGNPVIAMVRIDNSKDNHDYYHVRWNGSAWEQTHLAYGGGQFHQTPGLEKCYSGGMAIDDENPNIMYCSVPTEGTNGNVYEIIKYTVSNGAAIGEQITTNSKKNNARPYVITNSTSANSDLRLVWMNGEYYDWIVSSSRPKGYPTAIHAHFEFPLRSIDLENGLILFEDFEDDVEEGTATVKDGMLITTPTTEATIVKNQSATEFTISLISKISESAYSGKIFTAGKISYHVESLILNTGRGTENLSCPFPYVMVESDKYKSTNVLGNSDVWQTKGRGTGGEWNTPSKFDFFNLTVTYKSGTITTYVNGLIDQVIVESGLTLGDVIIGGFEGETENCRIYSRAISQEEIKAIIVDYESRFDEIEFNKISVPETIYTDIVLKSGTTGGTPIVWTSDNTSVIATTGLVTLPQAETSVKLTATMGESTKNFDVKVMPRNVEKNKVLFYEFEKADERIENNIRYVADKSGNSNDAVIYGNGKIDGTLNLTANSGVSASNTYAMAPNGIIDDVRSYTILATVTPSHLKSLPRLYDFGSGTGNSMFGRLSGLTIGVKYNGGTTNMINSSKQLTVNKKNNVAYTFDAKTKTSKIYIDGVETASGTTIVDEPYQLGEFVTTNLNYIGRTQWQNSENQDFCGTIDDFFLLNIALTNEEINQLQPDNIINSTTEIQFVNFNIFPNPVAANSPLQINCESSINDISGTKIEIIDIRGQVMCSYIVDSYPFTINSPANSGLYLLRSTSNDKRSVFGKLIVQ